MAGKFTPVVGALGTLVWFSNLEAAPPTPPPALEKNAGAEVVRDRSEDKERKRSGEVGKRTESDGESGGKMAEDRKDRRGDDGGEREIPGKFRERFEKLPPDAKRKFLANWSKWRKMNPREREEVVERALNERARIDRVIDEAIAKLGLELTPDEREVFELRYRQERRKLEEGLRDEVNEMRATRVDAMLEELRAEFTKE